MERGPLQSKKHKQRVIETALRLAPLGDRLNEILIALRMCGPRNEAALPARFSCKRRRSGIRHPYFNRPQSLRAQLKPTRCRLLTIRA